MSPELWDSAAFSGATEPEDDDACAVLNRSDQWWPDHEGHLTSPGRGTMSAAD